MPSTNKETWVVIKFIIAATGFKNRDARRLLGETPSELHTQIFMAARSWDRETQQKAAESLSVILQTHPPKMIQDATQKAIGRTFVLPAESHGPVAVASDTPRRRPARR